MYKSFKNILIESCKIKLLEALMNPYSFADKMDKRLHKMVDVVSPQTIENTAKMILTDYFNKESNLGNGTKEKFKLITLTGELVDATRDNLHSYAKDVIGRSKYKKYYYLDTFTVKGESLIKGIIEAGLQCYGKPA